MTAGFKKNEFLDILEAIETSANITDLFIGTAERAGVTMSAYMHFPAIGSLDFGKWIGERQIRLAFRYA